MAKTTPIKLQAYIDETTTNIREDRAMAKLLLMEVMSDMKITDSARRELGPIAAKYVENLQRSNEQLVKLTGLIQKQKSQEFGLSSDDKEQLFDLLNTEKEYE